MENETEKKIEEAKAKHTVSVTIQMPKTIYNLLSFRTEPHETIEQYIFHLIIKGFNTEEKEQEG